MSTLRNLCIIAFAILAVPAFAQKSKAVLQSEITTSFPDNTTGAITPAVVRGVFSDFVNSWQQYASVNPQAGSSYTIQLTDYGQLVTVNNSGAVAVTLPQPAGSFTTFNFSIENIGTGTVTLTPTSSTIGGNSSIVLPAGQIFNIVSDGTNWQFIGTIGTFGFQSVGAVTVNNGATLTDTQAWASSYVRIAQNLSTVGTGSVGSANQMLQYITGVVPSTSSAAGYEKIGQFVEVYTADPSNWGGPVQRLLSAADYRAHILSGNATGAIFGIFTGGYVDAGADGLSYAGEFSSVNGATADQASMGTTTSKYGIHLVADGTQNSTAAIWLDASAGLVWHHGVWADPTFIGTGAGDSFLELNGVFKVDYTGTITEATWNGAKITNTYLNTPATTVNTATCTLGSTCSTPGFGTTAPGISTCGTGTPSVATGSNNRSGQFTLGTGTPTACTITFDVGAPYANYAFCSITPASSGAAAISGGYYISAQSKTAFTLTIGTGTSSATFAYTCQGR